MDLTTNYLGLKLRSPLVVSASPLSEDIDNIKRMEDAGASAVVLYSLFEEQLRQDRLELHQHLEQGTESFAEALTYFPEPDEFHLGPEEYLKHIAAAKKATRIPIIASLNGSSVGGWTEYAKQIQQAGADALELNIYYIPTDMNLTGAEVEETYLDILKAVKAKVTIPVAVKLSPFFSNFANMAKRLDQAGANGLVLFNRFYQPDIDLETLEVKPNILLSTPMAMRLPLRWIALLYGKLQRQPRGDQRHPPRLRRAEDAHGRRGRDDALLDAHPPRHPANRHDRARPGGLAGRARIRIGQPAQGQLEPEELRRTRRLRARPIHEGPDRLRPAAHLTTFHRRNTTGRREPPSGRFCFEQAKPELKHFRPQAGRLADGLRDLRQHAQGQMAPFGIARPAARRNKFAPGKSARRRP